MNTPGDNNFGGGGPSGDPSSGHGDRASGGGAPRRVSSLAELPQSISPPRDLWASIESTLQEEAKLASGRDTKRPKTRYRPSGPQVMALAAVVAALAVGMWIGRTLLPTHSGLPLQPGTVNGPPLTAANTSSQSNQQAVPAAFVTDPRYLRQRAALLSSHDAELEKLPPETRTKVAASLATIRQSMKDIEDALGRDPSNALLQELLVNTYQDEMRVLTTVQASAAEI